MSFDINISTAFLLIAILIETVIVVSLILSIVTDAALDRRQKRADLAWLRHRDSLPREAGGEEV